MTARFAQQFLQRLAEVPVTDGLFNPWSEGNADDARGNGPVQRRERLCKHMSAPDIRYIAVGEAPGYQGARISGIPFTSEALLMDGAIPRLPVQPRLSTRAKPWSEPSARILWSLLYERGMAEHTVLWNACPFHPPAKTPLSNRAPTAAEVKLGLPLLHFLAEARPQARILAIGKRAGAALESLGIDHVPLRHPAYGGKTELAGQLDALTAGDRPPP